MDLTERIKVVMKVNNLSASQLADEMGVQRSNVSHILSGRNKPGFDFLNRLLERYPKVNAHWLITGTSQDNKTTPAVSENESSSRPTPPAKTLEENSARSLKSEPEIERIIVFYRNGTFRTYSPGSGSEKSDV